MKNVLLLTSSPRGEDSLSTQVATELARNVEGACITVRHLWRDPLPHIDPAYVHAAFTAEADRTPDQRALLALSDEVIAELQAADIVVIGAGMINLGAPSTLKSWVDHITRAGVTFQLSEMGIDGLIKGKSAVLVLASGGFYSVGPRAGMNYLEPYLRTLLGFLGFERIETVLIEGVSQGPDAEEVALAQARIKAGELARSLAAE